MRFVGALFEAPNINVRGHDIAVVVEECQAPQLRAAGTNRSDPVVTEAWSHTRRPRRNRTWPPSKATRAVRRPIGSYVRLIHATLGENGKGLT